ncbi:DEAD-domain-containing protein, partial [Saitoella complicata NRRL Y-17804]
PTTIPSTTRIPFSELGLSSKINTRLATQNYTAAFAVQSAVLPALLKDAQSLVQGVKEDLCVSAQTGSGKTLAYTIPIVEALSTRVVTRLRCLIVLPTRELVTQVRETFEQIAGGSGLKIGTSTGQRSFANEQTMLCGQPTDKPLRGGKSLVDILICTPGRLVDHIQQTPNFTLQHLRWLVVDEADRLLNQSFQEWADVVMNEIDNPANLLSPEEEERGSDAVSGGVGRAGEGWISACQKCIFSATLSRNPGKIASLRLRRPRLIMVHDPAAPTEEGTAAEDGAAGEEMDGDDDDDEPKTFSVPAGLTEHALISGPEKPLFLVQLIKEKGIKGAFVFTKSNESAARLARLLVLMDPLQADKVGLYSGEVSKDERKKTLTAFKKGTIEILVCSDLLARGLDLPSVPHIINYDPPPSTRQYIHRVGRTARAGTSGDAWSLILPHEARFFWKMVRSV